MVEQYLVSSWIDIIFVIALLAQQVKLSQMIVSFVDNIRAQVSTTKATNIPPPPRKLQYHVY